MAAEACEGLPGSHVKVYNVPNYGNVYSSSMAEYLSRK